MRNSSLLLPLLILAISSSSAQPSLTVGIEDLRRESAIRAALAESSEWRLLDLEVEAADGVVVLSGEVPTLSARDGVVAFVSGLPNVRTVRSSIRLEGNAQLPPSGESAGEETAAESTNGELPPSDAAEPVYPDASPVYHTVVRGDTMFGIARRYSTTIEHISSLNDLISTTVRIGQRIRVR